MINTDNTYQNLAHFVVDTTFFSNHVMKKMLTFMLKKELGPLPARTAASSRGNCRFYWDVATSFPGNGDSQRCISIYIKRNGS
jgi:hypothetical protein